MIQLSDLVLLSLTHDTKARGKKGSKLRTERNMTLFVEHNQGSETPTRTIYKLTYWTRRTGSGDVHAVDEIHTLEEQRYYNYDHAAKLYTGSSETERNDVCPKSARKFYEAIIEATRDHFEGNHSQMSRFRKKGSDLTGEIALPEII